MEIWKDIKGYEGLYQISNLGRVKSLSRLVLCKSRSKRQTKEKILLMQISSQGYSYLTLCKNNKLKSMRIHRLVALHFIPNPKNKPCVNHKNNIGVDNKVKNLEWCTQMENIHHAIKNGYFNQRGENHSSSKFTNKQIRKLRKEYDPKIPLRIYAKNYGVKYSAMYKIIHNKTYIDI